MNNTLFAKIKGFLGNTQIMLVLLAIILGALIPQVFKPLSRFSTSFLIGIFFFSSLRIHLSELKDYAKDWKLLLVANTTMLVFIPLAMWLPLEAFAPDWALPFLIIGAMPTGLTIALIADLFGGKTVLAMLISVTTSLLAPLTVPLIFSLAIGRAIPLPVGELFLSLFITIVLPFLAAIIVKRQARKFVEKHDVLWREISYIVFFFLMATIVANTITGEPVTIGWGELGIVAVMVIYMGGLAWLSYAITNWRSPAERITVALCMLYMNNSLALYIANRFFPEQHLIPKIVIILASINVLLPGIQWAAGHSIRKKDAKRNLEAPIV